MSNNVATNTKNEGRCSFSRKALSVATAAVLATTMVPMLPAESAWAANQQQAVAGDATDAWKLNDFKYTVEKNNEGEYVTEVDTLFAVDSITDYLTGKIVPTTDYDVVYFQRGGTTDKQQTTATQSVTKAEGGVPNAVGDYTLAIVKGDLEDFDSNGATAGGTGFDATTDLDGLKALKNKETGESIVVVEVPFSVAPKTISLDGAFAYENDANDDDNFSDTEFKYLDKDITFGFSVNGEQVDLSKVNVAWTQLPDKVDPSDWTVSGNEYTIDADDLVAGTYSAKLTAKEGSGAVYSGSTTVTFEIKPIDLSKDEIAIAPTTGLSVKGGGVDADSLQIDLNQVLVNGEAYGEQGTYYTAAGQEKLSAALVAKPDGTQLSTVTTTTITAANATNAGPWTVKVSDADPNDPNVIGSYKLVDAVVTHENVAYTYKNAPVDDSGSNDIDIALAYGDTFNPDFLAATYDNGEKAAEFDWKLVDAKGNEVEPADVKDGEYTLYLSTGWFKMEGEYYAGYEAVPVHVTGPNYDNAVAFVSVDDIFLNGTAKDFEYTGEPRDVSVVAKNGDDKLVEGEDYTVSLSKDGEAVESILDLGEYVVTVEFADGNKVEGKLDVVKADIESAKATADFFALPADGSAATPAFVGSTNDAFKKGQQFDLASDEISVEYYPVEWSESKEAYVKDAGAKAVSADELTEAGTYAAVINVLTTAKNIESKTTLSAFEYFDAAKSNNDSDVVVEDSLVFKVSKAVAFSDVDANEWYAGAVYTAASEGYKYMTGLAGTNLFMPNAQITRAQVAQVFFNMAGGDEFDATKVSYDDLVSGAWYGPAIAWASQAGIVTGYAGTNNFGPEDPATREQVATMIYRYMKAQGKDVSVKDESAALAKYADGASVSDFAKTAMAYCVEQGIFGVDVDSLRPQDNLSRAEMAATSVRVQPDGAYTEL